MMLRSRVTLVRSALHYGPRTSGSALTKTYASTARGSTRFAMSDLVHQRFMSTSTESKDDPLTLVYEAPMARAVRITKGVSVTSCILTSVGMPTLCYISEQSASVIAKWAMCGTVMLFGLGTTTLFHVLFKPFVLRMWIDTQSEPENATVEVETVTLFAQLARQQFALRDVTRPAAGSWHPMISFAVKGKNYFIHPECIQDTKLVKQLMGQDYKPPAAPRDEF
ncbi:hypothetical protein Poli38472_000675 [Pythium oligandrum]|uniref:Transmembrane protein 70 n=1 Tax=Pythium oligandrum TaxID=41045 RepID=A0A8K1CCS6_PYTOL|nr:hypothetical protein Poli38472_000675 [Pythium oligandrum]|eukprot:TMW60633.1 hypothetical protein Poli38472_000675 [Pythium oligandrum]